MPTEPTPTKTYVVTSRAWYAAANLPHRGQPTGIQDEISICYGAEPDGSGGLCATLYLERLYGATGEDVRLELWDDAFPLLAADPALFARLANRRTWHGVETALQIAGYTDATPTERPAHLPGERPESTSPAGR